MVDQHNTIKLIKQKLPEASWPWVIPSLHHDSNVWDALQNRELLDKALSAFSRPEDWSPMSLAFLASNVSWPELDKPLDPDLSGQADQELKHFLEAASIAPSQYKPDLGKIALIAASLAGEYLSAGSWIKPFNHLSNTPINDQYVRKIWETCLAVLVGLSPDPVELYRYLVGPESPSIFVSLAIHAHLSNPQEPMQSEKSLKNLLNETTLSACARLLHKLSLHKPEEAIRLSRWWLHHRFPSGAFERLQSEDESLDLLIQEYSLAGLLSLASRYEEAEVHIHKAIDQEKVVASGLATKLVRDSLHRSDPQASRQSWNQVVNQPEPKPPYSLVMAISKLDLDEAFSLLSEADARPHSFARTYLEAQQAAREDRIGEARNLAFQALSIIEEDTIDNNQVDVEEFLPLLISMSSFLLGLSYPEAAYRAAKLAYKINPEDSEVLRMLAAAARLAGQNNTAIEAAHMAIALRPTDPELRRELAACLEDSGDWSASLTEREVLVDKRFAPPSESSWPPASDLRGLAICASHVGDLDKARLACLKALEMSPEDGLTQGVLGEIMFSLGEEEQAMEHLRLATQQSPEQPQPWLGLANSLNQSGQRDKAIETLHVAAHTVEDEPAIYLALGELYLEEHALTQAESSLRQAHGCIHAREKTRFRDHTAEIYNGSQKQLNVDPGMRSRIAYLYGMTLHELGHNEAAQMILEDAFQVHASYPGIAYAYGKVLLEAGDFKKAIAPLAVAIALEPREPGPYIDYAYTLLATKEHPGNAVTSLKKAIALLDGNGYEKEGGTYNSDSPLHNFTVGERDWSLGLVSRLLSKSLPETHLLERTRSTTSALLAEAFEANGEYDSAIRYYSEALETVLARDESWKIRLSLGMARVAILLNQPEIAIAALQDVSRNDTGEVEVYKILCEAFTAIELIDEAMEAGRHATQLAPDDIETLIWFNEKSLKFGYIEEAVRVLERANELDPRRCDIAVKLADLHFTNGRKNAAHEIFKLVLSNPYAGPGDLYQAAAGFGNLGDTESAVQSLERALELQPEPPLHILTDLSSAYLKSGDLELALRTLDLAIDHNGEDPSLHTSKAEVLSKLNRHQAAQACLEHAIVLSPNDPLLHFKMTDMMYSSGNLSQASNHSRILLELLDTEQVDSLNLAAREIAANIARSLLDIDAAQSILSPQTTENTNDKDYPGIQAEDAAVEFFCLSSELALEKDEEISAAGALTNVVREASRLPRVQALQARLSLRQGDWQSANRFFTEALTGLSSYWKQGKKESRIELNAILGVALAAIDLGLWDKALELTSAVAAMQDYEPFAHLQTARILILRAEYQRLCQSMNVINHAPGIAALSENNYVATRNALQAVAERLPDEVRSSLPVLLKRWQARCQAVFQPGQDAIQQLRNHLQTPADHAALISTLSQTGDLVSIAQAFQANKHQGDHSSIHHTILAQFAIAMGLQGRRQNDLDESISAAQAAIDQRPDQPIYHAIHARLAQSGSDLETARDALQTALSFWPDEPRWQALAANLALATGDMPGGISHLDEAISLEPKHLPHYLALGDAHLRIGHPDQAIQALQQALHIAPGQLEAYMALASAQLASGKFSDAAHNAEKAIALAPNQLPPMLLRAEIALRMEDPDQAKRFAELALQNKSDDQTALHLLARALNKLGRAGDSMKVIESALPNASDPLPLLLERANLLESSHGDEEAYSALQELHVKYPDEPAVLATYAKSLAKSGKQDEAIRTAQRALRNGNGHLAQGERADLHNLLGRLLRNNGQLDQAIHQFAEATRMDPYDLETYLDLGDTLQERRQHVKAIEAFRKAISISPNDPRPYHQAGLALRECHDYQGAESMLRRAAELAPKDISIHRQLAALVALNLVHNNQ